MAKEQNMEASDFSGREYDAGNLGEIAAKGGLGNFPLKVVTGTQTTSNLNFDLKPGAIVAHPKSTVIFVCG